MSIIVLILVALVGLFVVGGLVFAVTWAIKGAGGIRLGHATLTCPHCGGETPATIESCKNCGTALR